MGDLAAYLPSFLIGVSVGFLIAASWYRRRLREQAEHLEAANKVLVDYITKGDRKNG